LSTRTLLVSAVIAAIALAMPAGAGAAVIYDQTGNAGAPETDSNNPNFAPSNDLGMATKDRTADDFAVPAGQHWSINEVDVTGAYNGSPHGQVNVFIYADAAGKPGTELFSQSGIVTTGPNYNIPLVGVPEVGPGNYWITVQQDANTGYWSWGTSTVLRGQPAQWRPDTTGPCAGGVWTRRLDCFPGTNPDQTFRLQGSVRSDTPVSPKPKCKKKKAKKKSAAAAKKCKKKKKKK
jgi:hypothetical protein